MSTGYYIGRDENGNAKLMHFKYVKRERKGDGWKYYYSWDEVKKDANQLKTNVVNGVRNFVSPKKNLKTAQQNTINAINRQKLADSKARSQAESNAAQYDNYKSAKQQVIDSAQRVSKAQEHYLKTSETARASNQKRKDLADLPPSKQSEVANRLADVDSKRRDTAQKSMMSRVKEHSIADNYLKKVAKELGKTNNSARDASIERINANREVALAKAAERKAKKEYDNSLIGRLESTFKKVSKKVSDKTKNVVKKTMRELEETYADTVDSGRDLVDILVNKKKRN